MIHNGAIDWTKFRLHAADDSELMVELAHMFVNSIEEKWQALYQAAEAHQAIQLQRSAHRIKSSVAVFGAEEARALAQGLEAGAETGVVDVQKDLPRLKASIDLLTDELRSFLISKSTQTP